MEGEKQQAAILQGATTTTQENSDSESSGLIASHTLSVSSLNEQCTPGALTRGLCAICVRTAVRRSHRCHVGRWTSTYGCRERKVVLDMVLPNGESKLCTLHDVLYVPTLSYNLLSVAKASQKGKIVKSLSTQSQAQP